MEVQPIHDTHTMTHTQRLHGVSVFQLCAMDRAGFPQTRRADHVPVAVVTATDAGQRD